MGNSRLVKAWKMVQMPGEISKWILKYPVRLIEV